MDLATTVVAPEKVSFPLACMKFFGKLPAESTAEFAAELRRLTPTDISDLTSMFKLVGYEIIPSTAR